MEQKKQQECRQASSVSLKGNLRVANLANYERLKLRVDFVLIYIATQKLVIYIYAHLRGNIYQSVLTFANLEGKAISRSKNNYRNICRRTFYKKIMNFIL